MFPIDQILGVFPNGIKKKNTILFEKQKNQWVFFSQW